MLMGFMGEESYLSEFILEVLIRPLLHCKALKSYKLTLHNFVLSVVYSNVLKALSDIKTIT